ITLLVCSNLLIVTNSSRYKLVYVLPSPYAKPDYQVEKRQTVSLLGSLCPRQGSIAYCRAALSGASGAGPGAPPWPADGSCPPRGNAPTPHRADPGVWGLGAVLCRGSRVGAC